MIDRLDTKIIHNTHSHQTDSQCNGEFCQGRAQEYRSLALGQVTIQNNILINFFSFPTMKTQV